MDSVERVVWSEGMLVSPQHLQQHTLYQEGFARSLVGALVAHDWGVMSVELDPTALESEQVGIQRFSGVLPGGLPVSFEARQELGPPPRAIGAHFAPTQEVLEVYLGVPREREGIANVAEKPTDSARARYLASTRPVVDLTSGHGAQVPVTYARPNPHILFGNEANDDFDAIKIAEIERNASSALVVSKSYVPPCLHIGASPYLMAALRELLTSLMARRRALLESTRESAKAALEFRTSDITSFLQLTTINAMVAVVQHMLDSPQLSPWQAYVLLVQLTGQLLTFSTAVDPTQLPKYAHTDLATTFSGLFDTIKELMVVALLKRTATVRMKMYPNGVLVGELDDHVLDSPSFVLCASAARSEIPRERMALELPKLSKIAAKSNIRNVVQTASNGVPLSVLHRPPPEIPIRENMVYFSLQTQHDTWKAVRNDRNVAIFIPPPYSPVTVEYELVAVLAAESV